MKAALLTLTIVLVACSSQKKAAEPARPEGCPSDMAEVKVEGASFCLDRTEVTVQAYLECVGRAECSAPGEGKECNRDTLQEQSHPVNCVDARQADAYCAFVHRRLPTDREWGRAAGASSPEAGVCWSGVMVRRSTCPVTRTGAEDDGLGVVDLRGNVAEWTSTGDERGRVVRGGGYASTDRADLTVEMRRTVTPGTRHAALGFRCARDR